MFRIRVLVAIALAAGLVGACEGAFMTLDDVTSKLTITNSSARQSAVVLVSFGDASSRFRMAPGTARTATTIGAADYKVEVLAPDLPAGADYEEQLISLRRDLANLAGTLEEDPLTVLEEMDRVQAALAQLHGSKNSQSCVHAADPDGHNRVTITYSAAGGLGDLWVLACD